MFEIKLKKEQIVNKNTEIIFIYDVNGNEVRVLQDIETGAVYHVPVSLSEEIKDVIDLLYVECFNPDESPYPYDVTIHTRSNRFLLGDTDKYIKSIQYAKELAQAIMSIFDKDSKHWELYQKMKG